MRAISVFVDLGVLVRLLIAHNVGILVEERGLLGLGISKRRGIGGLRCFLPGWSLASRSSVSPLVLRLCLLPGTVHGLRSLHVVLRRYALHLALPCLRCSLYIRKDLLQLRPRLVIGFVLLASILRLLVQDASLKLEPQLLGAVGTERTITGIPYLLTDFADRRVQIRRRHNCIVAFLQGLHPKLHLSMRLLAGVLRPLRLFLDISCVLGVEAVYAWQTARLSAVNAVALRRVEGVCGLPKHLDGEHGFLDFVF